MTAPAASPAALQTSWITGTSQTPMIDPSDLLADVPEEVHKRHRRSADDGGTEGDEYAELAPTGQVRVRRVGAQRPHDRRDDQRQYGEHEANRHRRSDDLLELADPGQAVGVRIDR